MCDYFRFSKLWLCRKSWYQELGSPPASIPPGLSNQLTMTHCTVDAAFVQSSLRPWGPQTSGFGLLSIPHLWELSHPCPSFSWDVFGELLATPFQWNMASICCTRDPGNMRKKYPPFPISFLLAPAFPKLYNALSVMFVAKWES